MGHWLTVGSDRSYPDEVFNEAVSRRSFWLLCALALIVETPTASATSFTVTGPFPSGQQADFRTSGVAVADMDTDGHLDLVVSNFGPSSQPPYGNLSVLWGDGAGGFSAPQDWDDGIKNGVTTADLDEDGNTDAVVWGGFGVEVFWGTGTRSPAAPQIIGTTFTANVVVADVDGDGDLDVIATDQSTDQVIVFYNDGARSFHSDSFPAGAGPTGLAVGQLDSHHGLDFAITGFWTSLVSVVLNSGPSSYQSPSAQPGGALPSGIGIGEFTGDGFPDLFYTRRGCFDDAETTCANEGVTILAGDGAGGFSQWATAFAGDGPTAVAVADLDGDGRDDVAVANFNSDDVSVFLGQGGGGLTALPSIPVDRGPIGIVTRDMNGDGCPDIVTANWRSATVSVLITSGCAPSPPCAPTARPDCRSAEKSMFRLKEPMDSARNKLAWKWLKGAATTPSEFADPILSTGYGLCVYAGSAASLIAQAFIPASAAKWHHAGTGYVYQDPSATADGVAFARLKGGALGKAKALIVGKGSNVLHAALPVVAPLTVQLVNGDNGVCWGAMYDGPQVANDKPGQVTATAP